MLRIPKYSQGDEVKNRPTPLSAEARLGHSSPEPDTHSSRPCAKEFPIPRDPPRALRMPPCENVRSLKQLKMLDSPLCQSAISIPSSRFHYFSFIFIHLHISSLFHFHFHFHFQYTLRSDINQSLPMHILMHVDSTHKYAR